MSEPAKAVETVVAVPLTDAQRAFVERIITDALAKHPTAAAILAWEGMRAGLGEVVVAGLTSDAILLRGTSA